MITYIALDIWIEIRKRNRKSEKTLGLLFIYLFDFSG